MKHFAFSKLKIENSKMRPCRPAVSSILGALLLLGLLASCVKHDEIPFSGTIVDVRECNASFGTVQDAGFVISLTSPDSIGQPYTHNGVTYPNAVILYDPGCRLYKDDKLSGSFYLDDKYSRANCSIHWNDLHLPEGVFLDIVVE